VAAPLQHDPNQADDEQNDEEGPEPRGGRRKHVASLPDTVREERRSEPASA
jgi:hypothetical protein